MVNQVRGSLLLFAKSIFTGVFLLCTSLDVIEAVMPEIPAASNKYVPPSLRYQPPAARGPGGPGGAYRGPGRRGNAPPDIQNTEAFPTLGATPVTGKQ